MGFVLAFQLARVFAAIYNPRAASEHGQIGWACRNIEQVDGAIHLGTAQVDEEIQTPLIVECAEKSRECVNVSEPTERLSIGIGQLQF